MASPDQVRGPVNRRIEGYLSRVMGQRDPAGLIRLRSTEPIRACGLAPPPGRTHDRNWPSMQIREKILAGRGPSTHDPRVQGRPVDAHGSSPWAEGPRFEPGHDEVAN